MRRWLMAGAFGLIVGCGPVGVNTVLSTVPVQGKLLAADGSPLGNVWIEFNMIPDGKSPPSGQACKAKSKSDGTFAPRMGDKEGVPPGKHKITLDASDAPAAKGKVPSKYSELNTTDLEVEITGPNSDLTIKLK